MNQLSPGPHDSHPTGPDTTAGTATATGGNAAGNPATGTSGAAAKNDAAKYDAVVGPFTIRDLTVFGSTLFMFVASLLPMFGERYNLWNLGNLFFLLLGIILPLVVVALFVARRLKPGTVVRVGSLSVDQFASVTASFAFPLFFLTIANSFNGGVLLGLVGSVGLLAATVLAPHLPWLSADFKGRAETPAHVVAREAAVPSRKPAAPKAPKEPKAPKPAGGTSTPGATPGYQAPGSQAAGTAAAAASTGAPGAGAPAAAAAISSPFAPPASYGTAPSQSTEAPAVVHSADSKPAEGTVPSTAGPAAPQAPIAANAPAAATAPEPEGSVKGAEPTNEAGKTPASSPEPATTQHAQQPLQQPAAQQPWAATMATPVVSGDTRKVSDSIGATVDPASRPDESDSPQYEAFWFAVAQPRTAYDEHSGVPAFTIEPGGWVLALEDRGHEFLVQDTDGKVGVLRELSNIERG
ncbi:hypothetical protein [Paenarthrobacter aurescens]|uniref:hypothetical protein n=1 Tax=Paenarthrobacter aurescens TaxID=43663 RepID=UPI0021C13CF8|nr:hypothetical protein [Paenarthrobacter aurescens]MCT9868990.1 hypothetical protein [Paenarthrobacter aurescens]